MEKANRIDATTLMEAVSNIAEPTSSFEWNGMEVVVNRVLPMNVMLEFVDYVVKTCFSEEGEYMPEVKDFAIKSCLLEMYANFDLPKDISERYAAIYNSDIVDAVLNHIEGRQFGEIINAIESKISNMAQMNRLNQEFENLTSSMENMFSGVSTDDVAKLINAVSNGDIDEGKVVQAFASQSRKNKVVPMTKGDK